MGGSIRETVESILFINRTDLPQKFTISLPARRLFLSFSCGFFLIYFFVYIS